MLTRYSRPEMVSLWSMENFFRLCFEIEAYTCDALAERGEIPQSAAEEIWSKGKFSLSRIEEIEEETRHQFIAFLSNISENIGESSRYLHQGMTSTDVLDTAFSAQLKAAGEILISDLLRVKEVLRKKAIEYKDVICIGRTHGMHAEPTTFGFKLLGFYSEFSRNVERMERAKEEVSVCAISGAVGNFANVSPFIEEYVSKKMGLSIEPVSTQVIPRDRHAMFFATLGVIASSIERLATEIRHLQRTEVGEVSEYFHVGQKGSSAMPHKSNPVLSENLTGLSRIVRSAVTPALEDVVLWHERDISHSSVERIIAPDATITLDFALNRLSEVIEGLQVNKERMRLNIDLQKGLIYSQRVLLALVSKGMLRDEAYKVVQGTAKRVWYGEGEFKDLLSQDKQVRERLSYEELNNLFDPSYYTKNIDTVFKRVLG